MDQETQEIIEEMKSEGLMSEEPKEEPAEPVQPEEKSEEPEEEPAQEPENKEEVKPRTPYVPYNKFKEEKTKWQEKEATLTKQIEELTAKATVISHQPESDVKDDDIASLAQEYDIDDKLIARIVKIAEKKSQLPQDIIESVNAIKEERERQSQFSAFEKELNALAKEFPDATSHKERLRELAFSENLAKTPLRYIFLGTDEFRSKEPKRTAEPSRGGTDSGNKTIDFERVKDDPSIISGMSDDEFDQYSTWLAKSTKKLNITTPR